MYDLETIRRLNEQAHLRHVQRQQEDAEPPHPVIQSLPAPVFPLSILARKLMGGPPSLAYFIELIESSEYSMAFLRLVREYLPDREYEIMSADVDLRVTAFCRLFEKLYFPLKSDVYDTDFSVGYLVEEIPLEWMGFSDTDYHYFNDFRNGYVLLLSLVASPWDDSSNEDFWDEDYGPEVNGIRVPILERAGDIAGKWLAELIPAEGWNPDDLHRLTDGTKYDGCGLFADWIWGGTGLVQLDNEGSTEYMGQRLEWAPDTVDDLDEQWPDVRAFWNAIQRLSELLESDPDGNMRELLALLLENPNLVVPKEQIPFPLDENAQVIRKEAEAIGTISV